MEFLVIILGLILGSFYNVVGIRIPKKESIINPGSHCTKCNHKLSWYENLPVFSYLFLKGKCKNCKEKISFIYPAMELLTAILFLISYWLFGISEGFFIAIVLSSLVVLVFITDSIYMIILDEVLVVCGILIFIIKLIFEGVLASLASVGYGFIIFLGIYLFMLLGNFIFKRESMGGGDIKLSFVAGMALGVPLGVFYLILGSFLAFPYAVYISIKNDDGMLPFGPFLVSSLFLCFCNSQLILDFLKALLHI